jgi:hypothetical protein
MRRILAGLALALLLVSPVAAASPTFTVDAGPYHYGDVLSVVVSGDLPGRPGEPRPKSHLRLDCQWSAGVYTEFVYSPASETPIPLHLGGYGISDWDLAGGGAADCTISLYSVRYVNGWYVVDTLFDTIAFHVDA